MRGMEDTVRVIGERQLASLGKLAEALAGAISRQDVFAAIERGLPSEGYALHFDLPAG